MTTTFGTTALQAVDHWAPWGHMGRAGSWFMWIFWLALLLLVLAGIRWLLAANAGDGGGSASEDPEETLKRRYAAGEIDRETFRRIRDELRG